MAIDPESYKDFERVVVDETDSKKTAALRKTLDAFVAETAKAALAVEGTWTQDVTDEQNPPQKVVMLRKRDAMRSRYYSGSTPTYDTLVTSNRSLIVNFRRTASSPTPPTPGRGSIRCRPDTCNFFLRLPEGVRLAASPFFTEVAVESSRARRP